LLLTADGALSTPLLVYARTLKYHVADERFVITYRAVPGFGICTVWFIALALVP
jgi:hypothetical protein